jgi:muramoyltetrapeptide carboxypeptidase LdcA involved in peptidoglycan recycling
MIKNVFERPVDFYKEFFKNKHSLSNINYEFWKGTSTKQKVILGGNIRCLLKLAGTKFFPDFSDKIIFLESLSGDWNRISSLLTHLKHLEVFNKIEALVLGEFTQLEKDNDLEKVKFLFTDFFKNYNFSIIKTNELGHGRTKGLLYIGGKYQFSN